MWGQILVRMDIGRIMNKYVGASEENMRNALKVLESCSPAILWLPRIVQNSY